MEHILSLSYGKDSLACLGAIEELGWPLDRIVHAEVWATDTIPADLPPMVEFKKKADQVIKERWGIEVEHIKGNNTFESCFYFKRGRTGRKTKLDGETPEYSCLALDRDRKVIRNGDLKYYRDDCTGYLYRGKAYHNINNMWWILQPCGTVRNVAAFELFDLQEGDTLGRVAPDRTPDAYKLRKEQLGLCSTKDLVRELKRRGWHG